MLKFINAKHLEPNGLELFKSHIVIILAVTVYK